MKRLRGWLWIVGVVLAIIAVQALHDAGALTPVDEVLNRGRIVVPLLIALGALGAVLVAAAMIHGLVTDASHDQTSLVVDERVESDTRVKPGKVAASYRGRTVAGNTWVFGYFRGTLLWGAELHEESGMSELKRSWRTGQWLHVHRFLRATLVTAGLLLVVLGVFGTAALLSDITGVRLLFLLALAFALGRTLYAFARA